MSIVIVGGLMVVALNTVGASTTAQYSTANHGRGRLLAASLLAEIMQQSYVDTGASPLFGLEVSESGLNRADFDDSDDYSAWTETPPKNKDGTSLPGPTGWTRSVAVSWVNPTNSTQIVGTDQGVKRIKVTVMHQGVVMAELTAIKSGTPVPTAVLPPDPGPQQQQQQQQQ